MLRAQQQIGQVYGGRCSRALMAMLFFGIGGDRQSLLASAVGRLVYNRAFEAAHDERPSAVAVDATGVYIVGTPLREQSLSGNLVPVLLRKVDTAGNELWVRQLGVSPLDGKPFGVATCGGAIYVAGSLSKSGSDAEAFVQKFDGDGNLQWDRRIDTRLLDGAFAVTVDETGVYVAGDAGALLGGDHDNRLFVRKYDFSGLEIWTREDTGWGSGLSGGITLDETGVYTAYVHPDVSVVRKYDKDGRELWRQPVPPSPEVETGLAADRAGSVYVVRGGLLHKLNGNSGAILWSRRFSERGYGVAADASGAYVAGQALRGVSGQCALGGGDAVVARFDADGNLQWNIQFGTAGWDAATAVATFTDAVFVAGFQWVPSGTPGPTPYRATLARLAKVPVEVDARPWIQPGCVMNAASLMGGAVAPGELITIQGRNLAATTEVVPTDIQFPSSAGGSRVLIDSTPAPLMYVSPTQINAIVPFKVEGRSTVQVKVESNGIFSAAVTLPVASVHPGLLARNSAGTGQILAANIDGLNGPDRPVRRGSVLTLFGTGAGTTTPPSDDGFRYIDGTPLLTNTVRVAFPRAVPEGGADAVEAEVLYAGGIPGVIAGVFQIIVRVPDRAAVGDAVPLYLYIANAGAQPDATVSIE